MKGREGPGPRRRGGLADPRAPLPAYFLLSGSFSLIFSSTLISSRAASLYFSTFLMIFRATRAPPLRVRRGFCWVLENVSN